MQCADLIIAVEINMNMRLSLQGVVAKLTIILIRYKYDTHVISLAANF